jgi:hypothetical protein
VFRVRAVARLGRNNATSWERALGAGFLPVVVAVAAGIGGIETPLLLGSVPVLLIGTWMIVVSWRGKVSLMTVGLLETAAVLPFAVGLVLSFAPFMS